MRVPSYRRHSSGQARVTINGKDHLLGKFGTAESHQAYGRLIAEYGASGQSAAFGKTDSVRMCDLLLAYLKYAEAYYANSTEYTNLKLAAKPIADLYSTLTSSKFGPNEFKAIRHWWLSTPIDNSTKGHNRKTGTKPKEPVGPPKYRSRQYVNKQMKRTRRILKWGVASGLLPTENYQAILCVEPLKKGRCGSLKEAKPITCVDTSLVDSTLPHLTQVVADMIRFQRLTGCRPGEVCKIKPGMVDRSADVWSIELAEHKTAYRGNQRFIFVGAKAQAVLAPYLLRSADSHCFSPIESERQRRQLQHEARKTPLSCGNRPGSNIARKPRQQPGECYTTGSYAKAIRYACVRAKLAVWSPNQLRHNAATAIRKQFGLEAAQVTLGHSGADVTQVYAEADRTKAIEVARMIG